MSSLQGKAIVITGAARGIGAAYAQHIVQRGARVVVNDVSQDLVDQQVSRIIADGGTATGYVADVSDAEAAHALIDHCVQTFGAIDGLINNAGIMFVGPSTDLDAARAKKLFEVNVLGTIHCGVAAMRRMIEQGHGVIVNVTSGSHMGLPDTAVYGASKGAIASLTYDWAVDLHGTGVRVNAISPMAGTQMAEGVLKQQSFTGAEFEQKLASFPTPASNAPVVSYLLSDQSSHLNGQVVRIDGTDLSLVSRPAVLRPVLTHAEWTDELVAEAFEKTLSNLAMPLGLLQLEGNYQFAPLSNYRVGR